jgi:hypothetical protein
MLKYRLIGDGQWEPFIHVHDADTFARLRSARATQIAAGTYWRDQKLRDFGSGIRVNLRNWPALVGRGSAEQGERIINEVVADWEAKHGERVQRNFGPASEAEFRIALAALLEREGGEAGKNDLAVDEAAIDERLAVDVDQFAEESLALNSLQIIHESALPLKDAADTTGDAA